MIFARDGKEDLINYDNSYLWQMSVNNSQELKKNLQFLLLT